MQFLHLEKVEKEYKGASGCVKALDGVSFSVEKGEVVAIIGHNGSGKSTLAKLCNGLLEPDSGEVLVDGVLDESLLRNAGKAVTVK